MRTRDILLLGLSGGLDLFEEIKDPFQLVGKSYENMYGWIPGQYKRHNFMHLVWRSIKTGYIEKIEKEGEVFIRLTSRGNKKVVRDFPLITFQNRKWDGKWRIVIFDIQEVNKTVRDNLRQKLKELGFGMLQKSVFISPHDVLRDIAEFTENIGLESLVYVFETSNLVVGDVKELARKVWKLDILNEKYLELENRIRDIEDGYLISRRDRVNKLNTINGGSGNGGKGRREDLISEIKRTYLEIALQDPFLPRDLLPADWEGKRARFLIRKIRKLIDK